MHNLRLLLTLITIYLLLTANIALVNIFVGLLLAMGIILLVRPGPTPVALSQLLPVTWAVFRYIILLMKDIALNAWWVTDIVVWRRPINPGIIAIPSLCETEMGTALSAHAITASPGEMVVEIGDDGMMYTHCLDATNKDDLMAAAQKMRVGLLNRIFD